jgi:hypothetical protein
MVADLVCDRPDRPKQSFWFLRTQAKQNRAKRPRLVYEEKTSFAELSLQKLCNLDGGILIVFQLPHH